MRKLLLMAAMAGCLVTFHDAAAGIAYEDPDGGWSYLYTGDLVAGDDFEALDGTWDHENGSDQWDGSAIGDDDFAPGGVSSITEGDVTFARFQDTGNPTQLGFAEPSNRKIYLTHDISDDDPDGDLLLSGVTLTFRTRLATDGLLDESINDVPDGYYIRDGGKATFSIRSPFAGPDGGSAIISFAPATSSGDDEAENASGALLMNNWDPTGGRDVDTLDGGDHRELAAGRPDRVERVLDHHSGRGRAQRIQGRHLCQRFDDGESFVVSSGDGDDGAFPSYIGMGAAFDRPIRRHRYRFLRLQTGDSHTDGRWRLIGDFNGNGMLDAGDIDDLTVQSAGGMNPPKYDLNSDTFVDSDGHRRLGRRPVQLLDRRCQSGR